MRREKSEHEMIVSVLVEKIKSLEISISDMNKERNEDGYKEIDKLDITFNYVVKKFGFEHGIAIAKAIDETFLKKYGKDEGVVEYVEINWEEYDPTSEAYAEIHGKKGVK